MSIKNPDHNDVVVGHRIRSARNLRGISQTVLADHLHVTFQQVQKYEKGVNRVSMGRLSRISEVLNQPLSYFAEGMGKIGGGIDNPYVDTTFIDRVVGTSHGVRMLRAYAKLNTSTQRLFTDLIESLTQDVF